MPTSYPSHRPCESVRNPLGRAEAQVAQLTNDLADLRREFDRAVSRLKTATSDNWRLKRRNAVLLAAQQKLGLTPAVLPTLCHYHVPVGT